MPTWQAASSAVGRLARFRPRVAGLISIDAPITPALDYSYGVRMVQRPRPWVAAMI